VGFDLTPFGHEMKDLWLKHGPWVILAEFIGIGLFLDETTITWASNKMANLGLQLGVIIGSLLRYFAEKQEALSDKI